jgi:putative ABC transport system permease protein
MRFWDTFKMSLEGVAIALDAMRANKVRAGLTILGVAVGVFVVVIISAAVHGINESVAKQFESAGPTTFFVQRRPITFETCDGSAETCRWRSNPRLTFAEAEALKRLSSVGEVAIQQNWGAALTAGVRLQVHFLAECVLLAEQPVLRDGVDDDHARRRA